MTGTPRHTNKDETRDKVQKPKTKIQGGVIAEVVRGEGPPGPWSGRGKMETESHSEREGPPGSRMAVVWQGERHREPCSEIGGAFGLSYTHPHTRNAIHNTHTLTQSTTNKTQ